MLADLLTESKFSGRFPYSQKICLQNYPPPTELLIESKFYGRYPNGGNLSAELPHTQQIADRK